MVLRLKSVRVNFQTRTSVQRLLGCVKVEFVSTLLEVSSVRAMKVILWPLMEPDVSVSSVLFE